MNEPRPRQDRDAVKRQRRRARAKRGLVAGYIHELSARHGRQPAPRKASG